MSKQCPKKVKMVLTTSLTRAAATEVQPELALAYEGPSEPRDEGGSQGNALEMIRSMNNDKCTKLLDDLCAEQGF
jgi:hypothetical protein